MTETEFIALLKLEGRGLYPVCTATAKGTEYMVMVCDTQTFNMFKFQTAKTYDEALKKLMKRYYEDN